MSSSGSCVVCGGRTLEPHLSVAGEAGPEGLIPTTDRFGTALADIARCSRCGHMQLAELPAEERLGEAYEAAASEDYAREEAGQRATAAALLARIERRARRGVASAERHAVRGPAASGPGGQPARMLDVGCWLGFLLAEARERGWDTVGLEPSEFASARARERLGLDVRTGALDALPDGERFDAIVMTDVLEHLVDPGAALARIRPALADGGILALALPDAGSRLARALGRRWWSVIPTHVQYFTRASVARLLESRGYEVVELTTAPKAFSVRYYLERVAGYSPRLSRALVSAAERAGLAGRMWAPDFRDRMLVLARPKAGGVSG